MKLDQDPYVKLVVLDKRLDIVHKKIVKERRTLASIQKRLDKFWRKYEL